MNCTRECITKKLEGIVDSKKAPNIEKSIFNFAIEYAESKSVPQSWDSRLFSHIYKQKATDVIEQLQRNSKLIEQLQAKTILAKDVAFLKEDEEEVFQRTESFAGKGQSSRGCC